MEEEDRSEFEVDPVRQASLKLLNTADTFTNDIRRKFLEEIDDMTAQINKLLAEYQAPIRKRKLKSIFEDEATEKINKKTRSSKESEKDKNFTVVNNKNSTLAVFEKSALQPKINKLIIEEDLDPIIRSKREAFVKAASMNNELANMKLNVKMRQTSLSKSNIYEKVDESEKENSPVDISKNFNQIKRTSSQEKNKNEISNNTCDEEITPVTDNKLMPPPKLPTKKKRGRGATASQPMDISESETCNDKPMKRQRRKKVQENSINEDITDEPSVCNNTRMTRSQARLVSSISITDVTTQTVKKVEKKKSMSNVANKISGDRSSKEIIDDIDTSVKSSTDTDDQHKVENKKSSRRSISSPTISNYELSGDKTSKIIVEMKKSPHITSSKDILNTKTSQRDNDISTTDIVTSNCHPLSSSTLLAPGSLTLENPDQQKELDATIIYEVEESVLIEANDNKQSGLPSQKKNYDETIILPSKNDFKNNANETIVIDKGNQNLYNASQSFLTDDLSEVEETPAKIPSKNLSPYKNENESPVKKIVKQFEELGEKSKMVINGNSSASSVTRKNSRAVSVKTSNQERAESVLKKKVLDNNKVDVISIKKVNGKTAPSITVIDPKKEKYRKREENLRNAAILRENQEKLRQAQLEKTNKENAEKIRLFQLKKDEAAREKKVAQQRKIAENEQRRQQEEILQKRYLPPIRNDRQQIERHAAAFNDMIQFNEDLERNEKSGEKEKQALKDKKIPLWAKREQLNATLLIQSNLPIVDTFYHTSKYVPNLLEIFPGIKSTKLQRNSSAVWKTPPRCSMMPKMLD